MYSQIYDPSVKVTTGQVKKHYTQMTAQETNFLQAKIQCIKSCLRISSHLKDKANGITDGSIYKVLNSGNFEIIEYNEAQKIDITDHRILIRDNQSYLTDFYNFMEGVTRKELCNICAVISLDTGLIVTAYFNRRNDNHRTIDQNRYNRNLQIVK